MTRAWSRSRTATDSLVEDGYQVAFGGQVPENVGAPGGTAELVGIGAAIVILLLAFGSVLAAGLPIGIALVGLGVGTGGITLLAGDDGRLDRLPDAGRDDRHRCRRRLRAVHRHPAPRRAGARPVGA